ncbi:MAG TPA: ThuA domain-containing protein [Planctomycetota bacterium]|nr:ThuA domain-containing protein [Planctomycetota bacterium]
MTRRWMLAALALAAFGLNAHGGEKIKLFFLQGGGHDWKGNFPILQKILDATGDFEVAASTDMNELKAENIKKYDLVLFYGSGLNFADADQEKGLLDHVRNGGPFAGIHSASDSFKKSDGYWEMLGGRFAGHGGGKFWVRIVDKEHVITKGLEDFEIQDETYRHKDHPNTKQHCLVKMDRDKEQQSMGWVTEYGKGRVFYTSLGHGRPAWENPHFQRLVLRGLYWAVGREPKDPPK